MLPPLLQIPLPGPGIPHRDLLLHRRLIRHIEPSEQEGDAPERLQLGDEGGIDGVNEAGEVDASIALGSHARGDQPPIQPARTFLI